MEIGTHGSIRKRRFGVRSPIRAPWLEEGGFVIGAELPTTLLQILEAVLIFIAEVVDV